MKFLVNDSQVETKSITTAAVSPWVDVTANGGDSIGFVMTASAASSPNTATIQLFGSADQTNVFSVGSTVSVSGNGVFTVEKDRPAFRYYRIAYAIVSGSYTSTLRVMVKGDR